MMKTHTTAPRPGAVTALGWVYILGGFAGMFMGGSTLGLGRETRAMTKLIPIAEITNNAPPSVGALVRFFENADVWLIVEMSLCSFVIISAAYFIRQCEWARMALEGVTWLSMGIGFVAAAAAIGIAQDLSSYMELTMSADARQQTPMRPDEMRAFLTAAILAVTFVNTVVTGALIYMLRRPRVRAAMG